MSKLIAQWWEHMCFLLMKPLYKMLKPDKMGIGRTFILF